MAFGLPVEDVAKREENKSRNPIRVQNENMIVQPFQCGCFVKGVQANVGTLY